MPGVLDAPSYCIDGKEDETCRWNVYKLPGSTNAPSTNNALNQYTASKGQDGREGGGGEGQGGGGIGRPYLPHTWQRRGDKWT